LEGQVFYKTWKMHESCPKCGVIFEREQGYFMVSVFIGYVMGFLIAFPVLIGLYLTMRPSVTVYVWTSVGTVLLATPFLFHYARVIWMHIDELLDPRPTVNDPDIE